MNDDIWSQTLKIIALDSRVDSVYYKTIISKMKLVSYDKNILILSCRDDYSLNLVKGKDLDQFLDVVHGEKMPAYIDHEPTERETRPVTHSAGGEGQRAFISDGQRLAEGLDTIEDALFRRGGNIDPRRRDGDRIGLFSLESLQGICDGRVGREDDAVPPGAGNRLDGEAGGTHQALRKEAGVPLHDIVPGRIAYGRSAGKRETSRRGRRPGLRLRTDKGECSGSGRVGCTGGGQDG